ncbi:hypothetical protein F5148DRAFT_1280819 [Russula earlei]|uniref:Uncharacterized protein n=1 Tax=Russula earlei TaxID=71964 RepID=A0ACC0UKR1_9AGAM|nr:hypothetical protein F5148DRAFT_1280819 [Russula earlei]
MERIPLGDPAAVSISVFHVSPKCSLSAPATFLQILNVPAEVLPPLFFSHSSPLVMTAMTSMILNFFIFQCLNILVTSVQNDHSTIQEFSERFKYDIISSSLLSSSITASAASTRRRSSSSHEDALSDDPDPKLTTRPPHPPPSDHAAHYSPSRLLFLFGLCLISLFFDSFLLYVLSATVLYYFETYIITSGHQPDFIKPTIGALNDLVAAAHLWDSAVYEAIDLLELEESIAPSSPPSSPLRAALHSTLQSTQTHSDNVRHVLVGLTSPSSLAQLTEMYAPPSPTKPQTPFHERSGSATATSRIPVNSTRSEKRATWNGSIPFSYAVLADAGSPSRRSLKRWEKRRSDVSALLMRPSGTVMSAPTSPRQDSSLEGVEEENANPLDLSSLSEQEDADALVPLEERGEFASAVLDLQRQRRNRGIEAFLPFALSPPPKYTPVNSQPLSTHITRFGNKSSPGSPISPRSSYSASRFTAMQIPRHPLSLHSLTLALNGALTARRYSASHLLALRFENGGSLDDGEKANESYWEDVRAVMALLTNTLASATAPLIEALDAVERERLRTENPTPSASHSRSSSGSLSVASPLQQDEVRRRRRQAHMSSSRLPSFAPLPSHLARFAAHVDALTNALNDAREHLESCVSSLRNGNTTAVSASATHHNLPYNTDSPALRAYERLRRELGLALRECERGRGPLLELLRPPLPDEEDEEVDEDWVPALESSGSDSDKDVSHTRSSSHTDPVPAQEMQQRKEHSQEDEEDDDLERGDVLVVGLERLPPPGIEQVFEADADDVGPRLARPRSKLSRAERIAAAKARRANPLLGNDVVDTAAGTDAPEGKKGWGGPEGDVVQELKDVIWKVGEQRRLREQRQPRQDLEQRKRFAAQVDVAAIADAGSDSPLTITRALTAEEDVFASPPSPRSTAAAVIT